MNVKFEIGEDTVVVFLEGELDHHNVKDLREQIDAVINRAKPKLTVLDLSKVPFSDSSGIAVVLGRYKLVNAMGGRVEVRNANPQVKKLLSFGGVSRLVTII